MYYILHDITIYIKNVRNFFYKNNDIKRNKFQKCNLSLEFTTEMATQFNFAVFTSDQVRAALHSHSWKSYRALQLGGFDCSKLFGN